MILGIGIDTTEIDRFRDWHAYPQQSLSRILSPMEIAYCLNCPEKSAERFAARFATREALFKALSAAYPQKKIPFLTLCKNLQIQISQSGAPVINLHTRTIMPDLETSLVYHVSWTHTKHLATAIVLIETLTS